jgi:hypothetical protein
VRRSQRPRGRKARAARRAGSEARGLRQGDVEARLHGLAKVQLSRTPSAPGANARHTDAHTHTHTQHGHLLLGTLTRHALCTIFAPRPHHRFPCVHRWKHNGRFGANVQIGTTGDVARTCRSGGRADRVGARIGGAQVRWAHRSGVRECSHVGRHAGARLQDGRCAGRSVRRTVGAQDGRCAGQLVQGSRSHIGMLCVRGISLGLGWDPGLGWDWVGCYLCTCPCPHL